MCNYAHTYIPRYVRTDSKYCTAVFELRCRYLDAGEISTLSKQPKYIYLAPSGIAITTIDRDAHHGIFQIFGNGQQSTNRTIREYVNNVTTVVTVVQSKLIYCCWFGF